MTGQISGMKFLVQEFVSVDQGSLHIGGHWVTLEETAFSEQSNSLLERASKYPERKLRILEVTERIIKEVSTCKKVPHPQDPETQESNPDGAL